MIIAEIVYLTIGLITVGAVLRSEEGDMNWLQILVTLFGWPFIWVIALVLLGHRRDDDDFPHRI